MATEIKSVKLSDGTEISISVDLIKTAVETILNTKGYITEDDLDSKNYVTEDALADKKYVTETDLTEKGYITEITTDNIEDALKGYEVDGTSIVKKTPNEDETEE